MEGKIDASSADHNRMEMLKAFDETKAGVKGLVDSGITKLPDFFVKAPEDLNEEPAYELEIPTIDISEIQNAERRKQIVEEVRMASESWGFFQVVNHGIPQSVLDGMLDAVREFHEQNVDEKQKHYTRDHTSNLSYFCSHDLFTAKAACWSDTVAININASSDGHELPPTCWEPAVEFSKNVEDLGNTLLGLLSEALGLQTDHLKNMEVSEGHTLFGHYYPACPQPELTISTPKHTDVGFLTILLKDQTVSMLQVLYNGQWVNIQPTRGGFIVNIGDLLQLVSNGKFKSIEHRVKAHQTGPRISMAFFFAGPPNVAKIYGPIEELISEENPPIYTDIVLGEYKMKFMGTDLHEYRALDYYKVV